MANFDNMLDIPNPKRRWIQGTVSGSSTLTRPADTNAYVAGDEVSNSVTAGSAVPWKFSGAIMVPGAPIIIRSIVLSTNQNIAWSAPGFWLFGAAPSAMYGDNAPFSHVAADDPNVLGNTAANSSSIATVGTEALYIMLPSNTLYLSNPHASSLDLYMVLVTGGAYTPISGQTFQIKMLVEN